MRGLCFGGGFGSFAAYILGISDAKVRHRAILDSMVVGLPPRGVRVRTAPCGQSQAGCLGHGRV